MTATAMHFGPEWMRAKQPHSAIRPHAAPSPPPASAGANVTSTTSPAPPGASSYSALVTPPVPPVQPEHDISHPFKYSKEEMLRVWKDGGGRHTLPIEVERWEGVVREDAGEPVCLREPSEVEKKLLSTSINSDRRRQTSEYSGQSDRPKAHHSTASHSLPSRDGLGVMGRRKRGDSTGVEQPLLSLPRKTSWSAVSGSLASPGLPSPRTRLGGGTNGNSGFDGVLVTSENAWTPGRRRLASGQSLVSRSEGDSDAQKESSFEIKEEEEVADHGPGKQEGMHPPSNEHVPSLSRDTVPQQPPDVNRVTEAIGGLSLQSQINESLELNALATGETNINAPPTVTAYGSLEWSYVDTSGNIQGPFTGDIMQSWHDQHYFTDDLMMKRTAMDTEFMPLGDIKRRAQGERIFLCPLLDFIPPPPGLSRQVPAPGLPSLLQRTGVLDSPRQPVPQSYGRSSTLDPYLTTGSASPSSSFGAGSFARPSLSPDPMVVGSRLANQRFAAELPLNGRISAGSYSSTGSPAVPQTVRNAFNDTIQPSRSSSFDSQNVNGHVPANGPWQTSQLNNGQNWGGPFELAPQMGSLAHQDSMGTLPSNSSGFGREPQYNNVNGHSVDPFLASSGQARPYLDQQGATSFMQRRISQHHDPGLGGFQQAPLEIPPRFAVLQHPALPPLQTGFGHGYDQAEQHVVPSPTLDRIQQQFPGRQATPISAWGAAQLQEPKKPRPFDADSPTANNTFIATPVTMPQQIPWAKPSADVQQQNAQTSAWISSSHQENAHAGWTHVAEEPQSLTSANSLTTMNVTQHNVQNETLRRPSEPESSISVQPTEEVATVAPAQTPPIVTPALPNGDVPQTQQPSKRKGSNAVLASGSEQSRAAAAVPPKPAVVTPVSTQKSAWGAEDEVKAKPAALSMGLREIQEAEKKKQEEVRKAEIERERAARAAAAASSTEEVQFTASWGLPTSRAGAGARNDSLPAGKEASTPSTPSAAPVWTNATKPAAKTMKEILEEEERRKQLAAKEKETVASAAKRAAQAGSSKSSATPQFGSAWTVVGSGGKPSTAASIVAARPPVASQASTPSVVSASVPRPSAVVATPRSVSSPQVVKAAPLVSKTDDEIGSPSPEFLKWMRDSLKGLNSTVQFEEIAQILLSFPLDPDPSTVELIAETVYGASTTLDGRRFASEFIAKRKTDAASRRSAPGLSGSSSKPSSLADVVKAQPKPAQNEFGGYKVVKKKTKGGRV